MVASNIIKKWCNIYQGGPWGNWESHDPVSACTVLRNVDWKVKRNWRINCLVLSMFRMEPACRKVNTL